MRREFLLSVMLGSLIFFWVTRARAAQESGDDVEVPTFSDTDEYYEGDYGMADTSDPERNILAFLALIRQYESANRYNVLYGGGTFNSYADHPRRRIPINLPGYEGKYSSAAGAYQFIESTWDSLASRLGLPDFSPASQDAAAIQKLHDIGAMNAIRAGDFDTALRRASGTWASLPYSEAKQNPISIANAQAFLTRWLS